MFPKTLTITISSQLLETNSSSTCCCFSSGMDQSIWKRWLIGKRCLVLLTFYSSVHSGETAAFTMWFPLGIHADSSSALIKLRVAVTAHWTNCCDQSGEKLFTSSQSEFYPATHEQPLTISYHAERLKAAMNIKHVQLTWDKLETWRQFGVLNHVTDFWLTWRHSHLQNC